MRILGLIRQRLSALGGAAACAGGGQPTQLQVVSQPDGFTLQPLLFLPLRLYCRLLIPILILMFNLQPEVGKGSRTNNHGGLSMERSAPSCRLTRNQVRPVTGADIGLKVPRDAPADAAEPIEYAHSCLKGSSRLRLTSCP